MTRAEYAMPAPDLHAKSGRDRLNEWGFCTRCLWQHNEADLFRTCHACRSYARTYYRRWYARPRPKGRRANGR